jgi:deazaflavin-dependent oxidoreductase (nitroreductase family)
MAKRQSPRFYRVIAWIGTSRIVTWLHPIVYRASGGRLFTRILGVTNVVLEATGARSGEPRPAPVFAVEDGDRLIVIASNGGQDRVPAWAANLRANPVLPVRVGRATRTMRARELDGDEREHAWALAVAAYPGFQDYASWTPRRIPVFALEPA